VAVLGNNAALFEEDARHHQVLTCNHLAIKQGIQWFQFNVFPADVLQHGRTL